MTDKKPHKLSHEILGTLVVSLLLSLLLLWFLCSTALSLVARCYESSALPYTENQLIGSQMWAQNASVLAAVCFFVALFLLLLGRKLAYIPTLTKGVQALQEKRMDFTLPLEGNNELTQLARTINYLSTAQLELQAREKVLQEEKEALIRALSHDIRTPLTSILSYSELLLSQDTSSQNTAEQLTLIRKKALQIKDLTDVLLDGGRRDPEHFEDGRLLMEQLADEMEEALEDRFDFHPDLTCCVPFSGTFDVQELRRIFDNLTSNIVKYADPAQPVTLRICTQDRQLVIRQENAIAPDILPSESYRIGLHSIRRIAQQYGGTTEVRQEGAHFSITVSLLDF